MSQQQSSFDRRRIYAKERYLRSEHLFHGGKFVAVTWTIKEVVHNCTFKVMGAKAGDDATAYGPGLEFIEAPGYVFGMNRTNESMLCMVTGEGSPSKWAGKKIQLVVRLIRDRKTKSDIPALRIWSDHAIHLGRVMEQMGRKVDDEWYAANAFTDAATLPPPAEPKANSKELEDLRQKMVIETEVVALGSAMGAVTDAAGMDACRATFSKLSSKLTAEQRSALVALADSAKARIANLVVPAAAEPPARGALV
jgi:hypothetical protein